MVGFSCLVVEGAERVGIHPVRRIGLTVSALRTTARGARSGRLLGLSHDRASRRRAPRARSRRLTLLRLMLYSAARWAALTPER